jgi:hypothetical protein
MEVSIEVVEIAPAPIFQHVPKKRGLYLNLSDLGLFSTTINQDRCVRFSDRTTSSGFSFNFISVSIGRSSETHKTKFTGDPKHPYVVVGIFSRGDIIPDEKLLVVTRPSWLFWDLFWVVARLRGIGFFLSLKDVHRFGLYKVSFIFLISY